MKKIFTRRATILLIGGMVIYETATSLPQIFFLGWSVTTSPLTNRTLVIFDRTKYKPTPSIYAVAASYSFPTIACFIIVLVGTIFLIVSFNKSRRLRDSMTGTKTERMSTKDAILVRSVIIICIIFIVGAFPSVLIYIVATLYPRFYIYDPELGNIQILSLRVALIFLTTSSSVNIFVYLSLSSRFRQIFKQSFLCSMKS